MVLSEQVVPFDDPLYQRITGFYAVESRCLDDRRYRDWLAMLSDDVVYEAPVRVTVFNGGRGTHGGDSVDAAGFARSTGHYEDDRLGLELRVTHIEQQSAWAEEPAGRTRRFVSGIVASRSADGDVLVRSSLLVLRSVRSRPEYEITSGERIDTLVCDESHIRLRRRLVQLDQTLLGQGVLPIL